jgi:Rrf2 family protein
VLITKKAAYGLLAMKHVALHEDAGSITSSHIADAFGLPRKALAKVLQQLADAGLLAAHHGRRGGYTLARESSEISALAVIRAIETPSLRSQDSRSADLQISTFHHSIEAVLCRISVADLAECEKRASLEWSSYESQTSGHVPCQK